MDLFIIIAAVLSAGGVVTASVYGLVNSSSSQYSIQLVQSSLIGTSTAATSYTPTLSFTVKNTGSQSITLFSPTTASTVKLTFNTLTYTGTLSCPTSTSPTSAISSGTAPAWGVGSFSPPCSTASPIDSPTVTWTSSGSSILTPGQQVTFTFSMPFSATTLSIPITTGSPYTLSIQFGTAILSTQLTSQ